MFNCLPGNIMELVYANSENYKIYVFQTQDSAAMMQSIKMMIQDPQQQYSKPFHLKRSQILNQKNCLDFLYDCVGDFHKSDIDTIKANLLAKITNLKTLNCTDRPTINEAYTILYDYVKNHDGDENVFISEAHFNISTESFDGLINHLQLGYKRLELLSVFKALGYMRINRGRPFDWKLHEPDGTQYRVYSFMLPEMMEAAHAEPEPSDFDNMMGGEAA